MGAAALRHSLATIFFATVVLLTQVSAQARPAHPSIPPPVVLEGFGVNIHFTDPQPGEMKKIAESGARWVRMDFIWEATEREKGIYDFSPYDRLVQALDEYGLKALFILDYGNPLYDGGLAPRDEATRLAFARWAVAAAGRYAGKGYLWEIWNEPNGTIFWKPKPNLDDYVRLARTVTEAFQKNLPQEALIGPASYRLPDKLFRKLFQAGVLEHWAALSIHPYRWWMKPETAGTMYARLRKLLREFDPAQADFPILSGEWGYSTAQFGVDEEKQTQFLPRMYLFNLYQGIPITIWYDWKDDGDNPKEKEHRFGIVGQDFRREKPAFHAIRTLSRELGGFRFVRRLPTKSFDDYVLLFEKDGEKRLAAWTTAGKSRGVAVEAWQGGFVETDYLGKTLKRRTDDPSGMRVDLEQGPKYLRPISENASTDPNPAAR